ncbi:MAG TPA: YqgE/AlgH family protein [Rhodospirillaceae bacterium]|nr:YqgE/AlgH family protein [Candidatus Neomarinimicrobiota bacterium]HCX14544.1 YqgE/AlgH family protein [Rhodospirillaceae bacterium]
MSSPQYKLSSSYLTGQFLLAMPSMADPRFERSVIYICTHSPDEAMGLIINKQVDDLCFIDILEQLGIQPKSPTCSEIYVHRGGPVGSRRGFVLHSTDYHQDDGTMKVSNDIALSATTEILRAIAEGNGPDNYFMALGYAGWGAGQLDEEIKNNAWLNVPADAEILFSQDCSNKWHLALAKLGISEHMLSGQAGHA